MPGGIRMNARIELNGSWLAAFGRSIPGSEAAVGTDRQWRATVPGSMYADLFADIDEKHPYYNENETAACEMSGEDIIYWRSFPVTGEQIDNSANILVCEGIDTLACIRLNGQEIGSCSNMHRSYRFDVTDLLKEGENLLEVVISSPLTYIRKKYQSHPIWGVTYQTLPGYEYLRKTHSQFGWDWGPALPDMGIWRDIYIEEVKTARIAAVYVRQDNRGAQKPADPAKAMEGFPEGKKSSILRLEVENEFFETDALDGTCQLKCRILGPDGEVAAKAKAKALPRQILEMEIPDPQFWWPNGYGSQPLYQVRLVLTKEKKELYEKEIKVGLRDFSVIRKKDQWGESFTFCVNGRSFFAKGANVIPEDAVVGKRNRERTKRLLKDCARSHYNCVRVWGGGYYADDWFYDYCDELGLIVWQDFMFACGIYDLTESFAENITKEFEDVIVRLRNHPCLGLWCGNNEMEAAWDEWGIPQNQKLRQDYLTMFERMIPEALTKMDPDRFYWPSSPCSGGGFLNPSDESRGDAHYWDVWHGSHQPFEAIEKKYFRFFSEYGFEALPSKATLDRVIPADQLNLSSAAMESHQKCVSGNQILMFYLLRYYPYPADFEKLIYATQSLQGDYLEMAIRHLRSHSDRCSGSIYWQVNDNWPTISWATIDYFGRWKGAQYLVKRSYEPLVAYAEPDEDGRSYLVYVSNDSQKEGEADVIVRLIDQERGVLVQKAGTVHLSPFTCQQAVRLALPEELVEEQFDRLGAAMPAEGRRNCYISYTIQTPTGTCGEGVRLLCAPKHFRFLNPELEAVIVEEAGIFKIRVSASHFARRVCVEFEGLDMLLSDNFFDVEPSVSKWIIIEEFRTEGQYTVELLQKRLKLMSNYDIR